MTRTFVDAGLLIAAARGNHEAHSRAQGVLGDPLREFVSSDFVKLEVLPKAIYHKSNPEADFYEEFFRSVAVMVPIDHQLSGTAYAEAVSSGLSAVDSLHVAAAHLGGAEELVTTEKETKPIHRTRRIKVVTIRP
jgi:predicted nucleic acid-binding protein